MNIRVDPGAQLRILLGRLGDGGYLRRHLVHSVARLAQNVHRHADVAASRPRLGGDLRRLFRFGDQGGDLKAERAQGFLDHGDRFGGLPRQRFDLVGDHGETASRLARPRRLDGGVQRQHVGLTGDFLDVLSHRGHLHQRLLQAGQLFLDASDPVHQSQNGVERGSHRLLRLFDCRPDRIGDGLGLMGLAGDAGVGFSHHLGGAHHRFQLFLLLRGPGGNIVHPAIDVGGGNPQPPHMQGHFTDCLLKRFGA